MATTEATTGTDFALGFTSQDQEITVDSLPVSGDVPAWLTGALVRVTPALLEVGDRRLDHWFDGIAMLNRFAFADGRVSYGSRFTESPSVNLARIGERYIAMTETPMPVEFDPETLDTIGHLEYADELKGQVTTAHPHHDRERAELVN